MKASKRSYLDYTVIFVVLAIFLYGIFLLTGKSFIWEGDGLAQHYPILEKFYTWLHQGSLTGWSWDLGLGADKLTTFSYYVLGDPFSYLIGLFPKHSIELGYNLLILLRLYVSGLAFMLFARQRSFKPSSRLLGTLTYTFTGYSLYVSIRHPFFLLPMILFPLLAYGIDHIYRQKSWLPLAFFTGLALISNFYFAYILAIGSFVYAVLRYFKLRETTHFKVWPLIGRFVGAGATGFLLSGTLLLPSLLGVTSSTRATSSFANGYFLYPFNYYLRLPNMLVTTGNPMRFWVNLGLAGLTFLSLVFVLRHFKRYLWLNISLLLLVVGSLVPAIAAVMNGMTTPSQRWLLLGCLAFSLAVMTFMDELGNLTRNDFTVLIVSTLGLLAVVWAANGFIYSNHPHDFVMYGLLLLTLGAILSSHFFQWSQSRTIWTLLGLLSLNIITNGYGYFSPNSGGASAQLVPQGIATKYQKNYYDGAEKYTNKQKGFHRSATSKFYYYANEAKTNMGINLGTHDIMTYFSIENGSVGDFSQAMDNAQFKMNKPINQADSRTTMNNLLGVKYVFARTNQLGMQAFPYGYTPAKRKNGQDVTYRDQSVHDLGNNYPTTVLKSKNALPLAYLQTQQLSQRQFNQLSGPDREQALTTGALVEGGAKRVQTKKYHSQTRQVSYQALADDRSVLDSLSKVVDYRKYGNKTEAELETKPFQPSLRKNNRDRSVNIDNDVQRVTKLTEQNARTFKRNQQVNAHGLKEMTSDNQNDPITYNLKVNDPKQTRNTELYLEIDGIKAENFSVADKYNADRNNSIFKNNAYTGISRINKLRSAIWQQSDGAYTATATTPENINTFSQLGRSNLSDYQNKQRVVLNLGYSHKDRRNIQLAFKGVKSLKFKSVKLVAVPFGKQYDLRMQNLKKQGLQGLSVKQNSVTGTSQSARPSVLTTSIPYSKGWHLTVDGKQQATKKVNVGFVGAQLPAGNHRIRLTYQTPGLKAGELATLLGVLVLLATGVVSVWRRRR